MHVWDFSFATTFYVVREYRRRGVGKALLSRCTKLAQELELVGIPLLSRIDNEPPRRLHESFGLRENETI